MNRRRAGAIVVALCASFVTAGWAVVATVATAHAAATICVALVVDFHSPDTPVSTTCARVPAGSSGSDVLGSAHRVTFDPRYGQDFVCAIDGKPAGGCSAVDGTHGWVYYHRAPGATSWTFSQEGAGSYQPRNASTEGWVYNDGSTTAPRPRDIPYDEICPPTSATPTPTARATSNRPAPRTAAATPASGTPSSDAPQAARRATRRASAPTAARATATTARPTPHVTVDTAPPSAAPTVSATPQARAHRDGGGTGGVGTGAVAGIAAGGVVGGAAWWRARRSRG
jgi:hypothetical protein